MNRKIKQIFEVILILGVIFISVYALVKIIGFILKISFILIGFGIAAYFPLKVLKTVSKAISIYKEKQKYFKKYGKKNENLKTYVLSLLEGIQLCYDENGDKVYSEELIPYCKEQMVIMQPPFKKKESIETTYFNKLLKEYDEKKRLVAITLERIQTFNL